MKLVSLEVVNWKCFVHKRFRFKDGLCIVNGENGTGKTSMFQAIRYALKGGTRPVEGLTYNTVRNDESKLAKVSLEMEINGEKVVICRGFGDTQSEQFVTINDIRVANGQNEVNQILAKMLPMAMIDLLWTNTLLESGVADAKKVIEVVVGEAKKDSADLEAYYKSRIRMNKIKINALQGTLGEPLNIEDVEEKLKSAKKELDTANSVIACESKAIAARDASKFLKMHDEPHTSVEDAKMLVFDLTNALNIIPYLPMEDAIAAKIAVEKMKNIPDQGIPEAEIEAQICEIEQLILGIHSVPNSILSLAKKAKEAAEWMSGNKSALKTPVLNGKEFTYKEWYEAYTNLSSNEAKLEEEMAKVVTQWSSVGEEAAMRLLNAVRESGVCPICHEPVSQEAVDREIQNVKNAGRSDFLIQKIEELIALGKIFSSKTSLRLVRYYNCMKQVEECENWEEILKEHERSLELPELYKRLSSLKDALSNAKNLKVLKDEASKCENWQQILDECERKQNLEKQLKEAKVALDEIEKWIAYKSDVEACPNWQKILTKIASIDIDSIVSAVEKFAGLRVIALSQIEKNAEINALMDENAEMQIKIDWIKGWQEAAEQALVQSLMDLASTKLQRLNRRYVNVYIDGDSIYVTQLAQNGAWEYLPVARMSNGERTLVSTALLCSISNILAPDMPLMFDETFTSLDGDNAISIRKFLHQHGGQMLVITHDPRWGENDMEVMTL